MNLLDLYNNLGLSEIKDFVHESAEESLSLEFKTVNHPDKNGIEYDKKNLSKCVSGFSNSSGGLVIWGIKASMNEKGIDVAKELKPINELTKFCNWIQRNEGVCVTPLVENIIHRKIEDGNDKGYLISYIPPSDSCPHMANFADKHYYKRSGDSFYQCEHYDIMDLINRKINPKLSIELSDFEISHSSTRNNTKYYDISCNVKIVNISKANARFPKLELTCDSPYYASASGLDRNGYIGLKKCSSVNYSNGYFGGVDIMIHSNSELEVDKFTLKDIENIDQIQDFELRYKLLAENMVEITNTIKIKKEILQKKFRSNIN